MTLLANWNLGTPSETSVPSAGTNNWVRLLRFGADRYVLRVQRNADPAKVAAEHRLLAELSRCELSFGIPTPLPTTDGSTAVMTPEGPASLSHQLPGVHPSPTEGDLELVGRAAGELRVALAGLPHDLAPSDWRRPLATIRPEFTELAEVSSILRREMPGTATEWFAARVPEIDAAADELRRRRPIHIVHGDFGVGNVLLADGQVSAVLDFELAGLDLGIADFVTGLGRLDGRGGRCLVEAFRRGYTAFAELSAADEAALPTMIMHRAIASVIWRVGVWQAGHATRADVLERLVLAHRLQLTIGPDQ